MSASLAVDDHLLQLTCTERRYAHNDASVQCNYGGDSSNWQGVINPLDGVLVPPTDEQCESRQSDDEYLKMLNIYHDTWKPPLKAMSLVFKWIQLYKLKKGKNMPCLFPKRHNVSQTAVIGKRKSNDDLSARVDKENIKRSRYNEKFCDFLSSPTKDVTEKNLVRGTNATVPENKNLRFDDSCELLFARMKSNTNLFNVDLFAQQPRLSLTDISSHKRRPLENDKEIRKKAKHDKLSRKISLPSKNRELTLRDKLLNRSKKPMKHVSEKKGKPSIKEFNSPLQTSASLVPDRTSINVDGKEDEMLTTDMSQLDSSRLDFVRLHEARCSGESYPMDNTTNVLGHVRHFRSRYVAMYPNDVQPSMENYDDSDWMHNLTAKISKSMRQNWPRRNTLGLSTTTVVEGAINNKAFWDCDYEKGCGPTDPPRFTFVKRPPYKTYVANTDDDGKMIGTSDVNVSDYRGTFTTEVYQQKAARFDDQFNKFNILNQNLESRLTFMAHVHHLYLFCACSAYGDFSCGSRELFTRRVITIPTFRTLDPLVKDLMLWTNSRGTQSRLIKWEYVSPVPLRALTPPANDYDDETDAMENSAFEYNEDIHEHSALNNWHSRRQSSLLDDSFSNQIQYKDDEVGDLRRSYFVRPHSPSSSDVLPPLPPDDQFSSSYPYQRKRDCIMRGNNLFVQRPVDSSVSFRKLNTASPFSSNVVPPTGSSPSPSPPDFLH